MDATRADDTPHVRESYLTVPGARLYVREIGTGIPLFILHGGPDFNHNYLLPDLDRLSHAFRLIYYDQRGRGRSSPGVAPEDVSIQSDVDDLEILRHHLGLDAISLLGHSWGGVLAMEYATRYADRVARLVLLNSAPASHVDRELFRRHRETVEAATLAKMRAIAATSDYAAGDVEAEAEYYRAHFGATLRRPEHMEHVIRSLRSHFAPEDILKARAIEDRLYAQTWDSSEYDLLARLGRSRPRMLVIHGDRDLVPLECAVNVAAAVPGSRLRVLNDCGHFSYLERPDEVVDTIVEYFYGLGTPEGG
jgi:proline iminopeptidase